MTFIDQHILQLLLVMPLLGAIFVLITPQFDTPALRQISLTTLLCTFLLLFRAALLIGPYAQSFSFSWSISLFFPFGGATKWNLGGGRLMLAIPIWFAAFGIFSLHFRRIEKVSPDFSVAILLLCTLGYVAISIDGYVLKLIFCSLSLWPLFYLTAQYGIEEKGSAIMTIATSFLLVDMLALFAALVGPSKVIDPLVRNTLFFLLMLPILVRLYVLAVTPWFRKILTSASLEVLAMWVSLLPSLAISLLLQLSKEFSPLPSDFLMGIFVLCGVSIIIGACLANATLDRKQFCFSFMPLYSSVAIGFFLMHPEDASLSTVVFTTIATLSITLALFFTGITDKIRSGMPICILILLGMPGIGIGTVIWSMLADLVQDGQWIGCSIWLVALLFYMLAAIKHLDLPRVSEPAGRLHQFRFFSAFAFVAVLSWVLPIWQHQMGR